MHRERCRRPASRMDKAALLCPPYKEDAMRKLAIVLGCLLYLISPIDVIPDPLVGPGQVDDLVVIAMSVRALLRDAGKKAGGGRHAV